MAALSLAALPIEAQYTASGYFTDGYLFRHDMNPAIANQQSYISIPALSNINVAVRSTIGIDDVLFNRNGKTTTFLNPAVSAAEFMSGIKDNNKMSVDFKMQVLGVGFKAFKGYNHIGINLRGNVNVNIPGSLFSLAKEGVANKTYDIKDFNAHAKAYAEIALGHSHKINDHLDIGASLKVLLGAGNVDAEFEKAQLSLQDDAWTAVTNAKVQASVKGLVYEEETKMRGPEGQQTPHTYVNDIDIDNGGLNGSGLAVDLGAVYTLNDDWRFSASLVDLGYISWSNNMVASTNGDRTFSTDTYLFNVDDEASNKFENEMDRMEEGLASLYELRSNGDEGSRSTGLAPTMHVGVEYTLPSYQKLSFGLLNSTNFNGDYSWTDFRLSANWNPFKILSIGANIGAGTYGTYFGYIFNFHPNGFNCYIAMDRLLGKTTKQGAPLSANAHINLGLNVPF